MCHHGICIYIEATEGNNYSVICYFNPVFLTMILSNVELRPMKFVTIKEEGVA